MSFAEIKEAWRASARESARLRTFMHDLGYKLGAMSDGTLRQLRNLVATEPPPDDVGKGMAAALVVIVDGRRARLAADEQTQATGMTARRLGLTHKILSLLQHGQRTTGELADLLALDDDGISRALGVLRRDDLIESDRRPGTDRRLRWHRLSPAGEAALAELPAADAGPRPVPAPAVALRPPQAPPIRPARRHVAGEAAAPAVGSSPVIGKGKAGQRAGGHPVGDAADD